MKRRFLTTVVVVLGVLAGMPTGAWAAEGRKVSNVELYQRLVDVVYGTVADRMASELVGEHRRQKAFARCVTAAGGRYVEAPYRGLGAASVVPGDITVGVPLAGTFGVAASERRLTQGVQAYEAAARKARARGLPAPGAVSVAACRNAGSLWQNYPWSTAALEMMPQLEALVARVQASPRVRPLLQAYSSCMTSAGYAGTQWSDMYWRTFHRFRTPDHTQVAWSKLRTTQHWRQAVAYEQAAGAVDTRCRRPLHDYAMRGLRPGLDAFAAAHAEQLRLAEKQWARLRSAQHAAGLR